MSAVALVDIRSDFSRRVVPPSRHCDGAEATEATSRCGALNQEVTSSFLLVMTSVYASSPQRRAVVRHCEEWSVNAMEPRRLKQPHTTE